MTKKAKEKERMTKGANSKRENYKKGENKSVSLYMHNAAPTDVPSIYVLYFIIQI